MSGIISRRFNKNDTIELNALYNLVAGRSRTIKQFEWEWLDNPNGWGSMWLIVDEDKNKIIGHHGLIPIQCSYFGETILAGKTENTVMHPDYRGKRIYFPFEKKFLQEAGNIYQMNYTVAGAQEQGRIRLKLGYKIVSSYAHYIKIFSRNELYRLIVKSVRRIGINKYLGYILRFLSILACPVLMIYFSREGKIDKEIELYKVKDINEIAEEWDYFWKENKDQYGITVHRTSKYLKWRIFDNPNIDYDFYVAKKDGEILGCVITKINDTGFGAIEDIVAKKNDEIIFNSILRVVSEKFREKGIFKIRFNTLLSNNFLNNTFRRNGFFSSSLIWKILRKFNVAKQVYMVKALDSNIKPEIVYNAHSWYYTALLGEGVN